MDEPTVGLDPEERVRFRNLLSSLSGERIVILSTHIVSDVEATALEIAIIGQGRLLTHDTPEALLREVDGKVWSWVVSSAQLPEVNQQYLVSGAIRRSDGVHVRAVVESLRTSDAESVAPTLWAARL